MTLLAQRHLMLRHAIGLGERIAELAKRAVLPLPKDADRRGLYVVPEVEPNFTSELLDPTGHAD
jgi:hypothetical protein